MSGYVGGEVNAENRTENTNSEGALISDNSTVS